MDVLVIALIVVVLAALVGHEIAARHRHERMRMKIDADHAGLEGNMDAVVDRIEQERAERERREGEKQMVIRGFRQ